MPPWHTPRFHSYQAPVIGSVRKHMNKYLIIILLFSAVALPCSIMCPETHYIVESSNYIFVGKVVSVNKYGINWFTDEPKIKVKFEVTKNLKGEWGSKILKTTLHNGYSCTGSSFIEKKRYIVFLTHEEQDTVSPCGSIPFDKVELENIEGIIEKFSNK